MPLPNKHLLLAKTASVNSRGFYYAYVLIIRPNGILGFSTIVH